MRKKQSSVPSAARPISIEKRLIGYGTMSVAIAAAFAPSASAGTVYWPVDVTTPVGGGIYFNVVTGSVTPEPGPHGFLTPGSSPGAFALSNEVGSSALLKAFALGSSKGLNNRFAVSSSQNGANSSAARLALGKTIGPGLNFANFFSSLASNRETPAGHWNALGTGYLGLTFDIGPQTDYGWAEITVNSNYTITLDGMAYDSSGSSISAGAGEAPEPNSLLLMALGAAGLGAYRRKRAARPKPANQG